MWTRRRALPRPASASPSRTRSWTPTTPVDALPSLTVYLVLLFALPSRLTIGFLGGFGAPATLVSAGLALLWLWTLLLRSQPQPLVVQPMRRAILALLMATLASFIAATSRPISSDEVNAAQSTLLFVVGWSGVCLFTADHLSTRASLDRLLDRISVVAAAFAGLGLAQYVTRIPLTDLIQLPGLSLNSTLDSVGSREGLVRPASTALHAIEFGVALTAALPVCLHVALHHLQRSAVARWFPVALVAVALPISISRSAIVGVAIVAAIVLPTWPRATRNIAVAVTGLGVVAVFVMLPGLIGAFVSLFSGVSNDPSARSRTDSYELAFQFVAQSPIFGRGIGTFLPKYRILDNQYLLTLIDMGVVGLVALLALFTTAMWCAYRIRQRTDDPATRDLAQSLLASIAASTVGFALFDGLSFPLFAGFVFLVQGITAALWRLEARLPCQFWKRWE